MNRIPHSLKNDTNHSKRVLIITNKWWECNPLMFVLLNDYARPAKKLGWPRPLNYPFKKQEKSVTPRAVFNLSNIKAEIWCVSDLLAKYPDTPEYQSSSARKMKHLAEIFNFSNQSADLVVSVGTAAAYPPDVSINGSVVVGTRVFLHNCHPNDSNPDSKWHDGPFDSIINSPLKKIEFDTMTSIETDPPSVMNRFLVPPINPDPNGGRLIADYDNVALNTINVTNYSEYSKMDRMTRTAFKERSNSEYGKSIETTHGLIRIAAGFSTPYLFVSGIVDREGYFQQDVVPRPYAQNTSGAHNAGIVIVWMLPEINKIFS